ncbi:PspC domain-containing protein [Acidothermaceae bacterium B102]|nr:PspC domain-containing protein [Acidothermaceae bacterium B102]
MTTPDAPSAPPYRPLLRSRDDRVVAGVAGGLGRWLDLDPVIFRVTFAVLTLFGGLGLVGYLIGYLLIPDEATGQALVSSRMLPDLRRLTPQQRALAGWGAAGLAVIVAVAGHRSTTVAVLLIVAGVVVLALREGNRPASAGYAPESTPQQEYAFSPPPGAVVPPTVTFASTATPTWQAHPTGPAWEPRTYAPLPRPEYVTVERGPRLNRALISAAVLAAGIYLLIGQAGAYQPRTLPAIAVGLTTLGVGLAATAWRARSRLALVLGVLLSAVVMIGSLIQGDYGSSIGKRDWQPRDSASIASEYKLAAGDATLDLTQVGSAAAGRTIKVTMGAGRLTVFVPDGLKFSATGDVPVGSFSVFGERYTGPDTHTIYTPGFTTSDGVRILVHLRIGNVEVLHG